MEIEPLSHLNPVQSLRDATRVADQESGELLATSFQSLFKRAVAEVNKLQNEADDLAAKLAAGDIEDVHRAMIAMQKAKLALDLTIQVRNKVIEAYQEVMRMQV
ncbi:MAG: flagellar hook-basal body complex protein FliE [Armatimonadota bacterium]|nr:flagellar hook-basal body complex protein FliE [Armatimonadota bacterium]